MKNRTIYDYYYLEKRFNVFNLSKKDIAKSLEITTRSLNNKLSGKTYFNQREISILCKKLSIKDVYKYFFTELE